MTPRLRIRTRVTTLLSAAVLIGAVVTAATPATGALPRPSAPLNPTQGNGRIAIASDRTGDLEIWRMRPDGSVQNNLTNRSASDEFQPAWSPDGRKIAYTSNRDGNDEIYVMNPDGSGQTNLTRSPSSSDSEPSWSPDSTQIAFTSNRSGENDVWTMNASGSGQTNLTNDPDFSETQPAWSPTGGRIAFTSNRSGAEDVYTIKLDGTGRLDLSNNPANDSQPAWSPDAKYLAFTSDRDGNDEVYVMASDGTSQLDVSNDPGSDSQPTFSPDRGSRVAFTSDRQGESLIYIVNVNPATSLSYGLVAVTHLGDSASDPSWEPLPVVPKLVSPIQNVVILFMENHSFDNVLGKLCVQTARCEGTTMGQLYDGTWIDLPPAADNIPRTLHSWTVQVGAINGGKMNGFSQFPFCDEPSGYACYQQFDPTQTPTITSLFGSFAISDRTFELDTVGSWGGHLGLAAANLNGFYTATPKDGQKHPRHGWGCDSNRDSDWAPTPTDPTTLYPMCIPQRDATGPYRPSPVPWEPTMMDRMQEAGLSWHIYSPTRSEPGYGYALCPTFADCLYTGQKNFASRTSQFLVDAQAGNLANLSFVMPEVPTSEHNGNSMLAGENYMASVVNTVMDGPQWNSTAIFITYDDCGCFYDHVPPPAGLGIRVPMMIVSPYAKAGYTDTNVASFASMLSFVEHIYGLAPVAVDDAEAYDYADAFNFAQKPIAPIHLKTYPIPRWEQRWLKEHPPEEDFT